MHQVRLAAAISIAVSFAASQAGAVLPPVIAGEIHTVVASYEAEVTRGWAVAGSRGEASEGAAIQARAREMSARRMADAVSDGIGRRPDLTEEIVVAALSALPHARPLVVGTVSSRRPDAAPAIRAAAGRVPPAPPAPSGPDTSQARAAAAPALAQAPSRMESGPVSPPPRTGATVPDTPLDIRPVPAPVQRAAPPEHPVLKLDEETPAAIAPVAPPAPREAPPEGAVREFSEPPLPPIDPVPDPGTGGARREPLPRPGGEDFAAPIPDPVEDPFEDVNRVIFAANDALDTYLLRPVAWGYAYVMPDAAERAVRRGFKNLKEPIVFASDVFQGAFSDAGVAAGRFLVNSTVGVAGLFDVAKTIGMPAHPADFGQALHSYGADPGPYLMIPILGPTTVRDGLGDSVDSFFSPLEYLTDWRTRLGVAAADGLTLRAELIEPLDELKESSLDYYAAIRSAYYQDRATTLRRGKPAPALDVDAEFDRLE